jgi:hypothetical protein
VTSIASIPVGKYLPKAILAGVLGVAVGVGACAGMGGNTQAMVAAGSVVAIAAVLGLVPAVMPPIARVDRFGMAVLAMTMAQTLLAIGAAFALTTMFELSRKPLVMGAFAGVLVVMMVQAVTAAMLLNSLPSSAFTSSSNQTKSNQTKSAQSKPAASGAAGENVG